jgi:hypothetical protein
VPGSFSNAVPVCEGLGAGRWPLCQYNRTAPLLNSRPSNVLSTDSGATMTEAQALGLLVVVSLFVAHGVWELTHYW